MRLVNVEGDYLNHSSGLTPCFEPGMLLFSGRSIKTLERADNLLTIQNVLSLTFVQLKISSASILRLTDEVNVDVVGLEHVPVTE